MEVIAVALVVMYYVGAFTAMFTLPRRAGMRREAWLAAFAHPGSRRIGIPLPG